MCDQELAIAVTLEHSDILLCHQAYGDEIPRQWLIAQGHQEVIEEIRGQPLEYSAAPLLLNTIDDVAIPLQETLIEGGKDFRLLLQVAVYQEDQATARLGNAGHHRLVMTEVAREVDDDHPRVGLCKR